MEKITAVIIGAILGFLMPYGARVWDKITKSRRMTAALKGELREALEEVKAKIRWIERDVSKHLDEVDQSKVVKMENGEMLYLGEDEKFAVPRDYWKNKYTDIAETINHEEYARIYKMYRLVDAFEQKFTDMKKAFDCEFGKTEFMALACLKDLKEIAGRLENGLDHKLVEKCSLKSNG